jgi:hypothetical protein
VSNVPGYVSDYIAKREEAEQERQQEAREELWGKIEHRIYRQYPQYELEEEDTSASLTEISQEADRQLRKWEALHPDKSWEQRLEILQPCGTRTASS